MTSYSSSGRVNQDVLGNLMTSDFDQIVSQYSGDADMGGALNAQNFGLKMHQQNVNKLNRDIEKQKEVITQIKQVSDDTERRNEEIQTQYNKKIAYNNRIVTETQKLDDLETPENTKQLSMLRALVGFNENLKNQENQFKANCKKQRTTLQEQIEKLKAEIPTSGKSQEAQMIDATYAEDLEKLKKMRQYAAKRNRDIVLIERKIDEIPSRTELAQYTRQFVELYETVASKETETRQYFTSYNTLEDTKKFLQKEVSILNSIGENYKAAMSSKSSKEQLLTSLNEIVKSVGQNVDKMDQKLNNEKETKSKINEKYTSLVEKERLYYKATKEFLEECKKNEMLLNHQKQQSQSE